MNQMFIDMAREASNDSTLVASLIQQYARRDGLSWEQIAARMNISLLQLAKLALCERPPDYSPVAAAQMAEYVGVSKGSVAQFMQRGVPSIPNNKPTRNWSGLFREVSSMFRHRRIAFAFAAIVTLVLSAFVFAQPAETEATLVVSSGEAIVIQDDKVLLIVPNNTETAVSAGKLISVGAGDVIKLPTGAEAQLRLYDGSSVDIFEGTTLKVSELVTNDETYRVRLTMLTGRTVNRVARALGIGDRYEVHTPSSTASVRGTIFTVDILSDTSTYFSCDEGVVHISMGGQGVDIRAGEEITAVLGQPLTDDEADKSPVGPPDQVPGHTPTEVPGNGNPPDGDGDPPGKPAVDDEEVPDQVPPVDGEDETGPPEQVPGNTPDDPPGEGNPPDSGGDPPGQGDDGDDDDGDDNGDNDGDDSGDDDGGSNPPVQVPGHTPDDLPEDSEGNPPGGGGTPPGQGGTPPGQDKKN